MGASDGEAAETSDTCLSSNVCSEDPFSGPKSLEEAVCGDGGCTARQCCQVNRKPDGEFAVGDKQITFQDVEGLEVGDAIIPYFGFPEKPYIVESIDEKTVTFSPEIDQATKDNFSISMKSG